LDAPPAATDTDSRKSSWKAPQPTFCLAAENACCLGGLPAPRDQKNVSSLSWDADLSGETTRATVSLKPRGLRLVKSWGCTRQRSLKPLSFNKRMVASRRAAGEPDGCPEEGRVESIAAMSMGLP
jgi:hypothetical protein